MSLKKGFTLIELLVVIAIIAMLLAVLTPSLRKAREASRRMYCMSSIRMLTTAWHTYATDNSDKLAEAKTTEVVTTSFNQYGWSIPNPTLTGFWNGSLDNRNALEGAIRIGTFLPYSNTLEIYRCTNHEAYARGSTELGMEKRLRSYSIVDAMNGFYLKSFVGDLRGGVPFKRLTEIPNTGSQIVFLDEGRETPEGWTIYPDREQWWDEPPTQHDNGSLVSFADGHAEYWKWQDKRTIQFVEWNLYRKGQAIDATAAAKNNLDFQKLQQGIWGIRRGR
jgi:prepilin-type N-terminal cleavage/methylation domain-containing protein/prepilin-type processing-associated H-X9-DG protein